QSGGLVSQPNSVTQKRTGPDEMTCPAEAAAASSVLTFGRSPSDTSSGRPALSVGPPAVYGCVDHTSKWTVSPQVGFGATGSLLMQRTFCMNNNGPIATTPLVPEKGLVPPAMTRLSGRT